MEYTKLRYIEPYINNSMENNLFVSYHHLILCSNWRSLELQLVSEKFWFKS